MFQLRWRDTLDRRTERLPERENREDGGGGRSYGTTLHSITGT